MDGDNMPVTIRPLGHASFQIKTESKTIYIDPKKYGKTVEATEKADLMLVTHAHADHCNAHPNRGLGCWKEY
jgi:L-ascorbate metabolism protein UlaG (beta-lactamase superfamily)